MKNYSPMLAKETTLEEAKLLIKKGWIVEEKRDGIRCLIFYENGKVKIQNRRGDDITNTYPEIHSIKLKCKSAVLDCEFVAVSGNFQDIQKRTHLIKKADIELRMKLYPVIAVCFDLLNCDGIDLTNKPLIERQEKLAEIIVGHSENLIQIASLNPSEKEFMEIWELVKKEGLEGLMLKDENSIYENGVRSPNWLKLKFRKESIINFSQYRITTGKKGQEGFILENEQVKVVCNSLEQQVKLRKLIDAGKTVPCEIEYLGITNSGRFRQPTFKRVVENEGKEFKDSRSEKEIVGKSK